MTRRSYSTVSIYGILDFTVDKGWTTGFLFLLDITFALLVEEETKGLLTDYLWFAS
jgi:hypothetical protein